MKTYNNLPIYDLRLEADIDGVSCISLVEYPAIEQDFLAFSDNVKENFTVADNDKHILYGPAMLPDTPIYRRDKSGREYYVTFSKETIAKIAEKFYRDNRTFNISVDHEIPVTGCYVFMSYLIDRENGINPTQFSKCPDGTWITAIKVENEQVWDAVKNTDLLKGFSVEIMATPHRMSSDKSNWVNDLFKGKF